MEDLIYFSFNEKSSVLLIFFFHALLFSTLLLVKGVREKQKQSKWLSAFIFLGGLYIVPFLCGYANWYAQDHYREFLFFMPMQQLFLLGPVFFFYIKSLLNPNLKLSRRDLLHFLPAALYLVYSLVVFVTDELILDEYYFYADGKDKDLDFWYQMAGLISMLFYLYLTLKLYLNYRRQSLQEVSFADEIAFKWIQHFVVAFALILILRGLFFILHPEWWNFGRKYWYYLCFSILILFISIRGYTHTIKVSFKRPEDLLIGFETVELEVSLPPSSSSTEDLPLGLWKDKINQLFGTEEVYKNPKLTLTELADLLHTNRTVLSKAINQEFGMNFNDLVNEKRAEAVIEKLKLGEHRKSTLLGIAMDCGFNSKTTFYRAFKKHNGTTPKQYINQHQL